MDNNNATTTTRSTAFTNGNMPGAALVGAQGPLTDVQTLRNRARQDIEGGAIMPAYAANREAVIRLLNEALATELVCVLRYKRHYYTASGIHSEAVTAEFAEHAAQELEHVDQIASRIVQLGGDPDFHPDRLTASSHAEYNESKSLGEMIKENLIAERIAIDSYREMINFVGTADPTTRRMLEEILAVEEEHADDMASLLDKFKTSN
jgi:bacterioferritin